MSVNSSEGQQKSEPNRDFPEVYSYTQKRILSSALFTSLYILKLTLFGHKKYCMFNFSYNVA